MSPLEELEKRMGAPEFAESAKKYMENYFFKIEEHRKKVSSKEYINWIYKFVLANKHVDDESALYIYKGIDSENGNILGAFFDYIKEIAVKQRVLVIPDDECEFENERVSVKIKDKYFEIFRMYGQGSWTSINLLDKEPNYAYVKL